MVIDMKTFCGVEIALFALLAAAWKRFRRQQG